MGRAVTSVWGLTMLLVTLVGVAAGVGAWRSSVQGPLPASLEGPCLVRASLSPGDVVVDPSVSGGVYEIPPAALIEYSAVLSDVTDPGRRQLEGRVGLDLPPPFGLVNVASWSEAGSNRSEQGTYRYNLPARWAPTGVTLRVQAEHAEPGRRCTGALTVRLAGSAFGSLLRPVAVVLLVGSAWLLARAGIAPTHRHDPWSALHRRSPASQPATDSGRAHADPSSSRSSWEPRGRPAFGVLVGLVFGLFAAVVLLLAGAVVLHSAWVTAVVLAGVAIGLAIGWIGHGPPRSGELKPKLPQEARELTLLEPS
jgi:hypothetical protein